VSPCLRGEVPRPLVCHLSQSATQIPIYCNLTLRGPRHAGLTQREIASLLGLTCGSAVSCQLRLLPDMLRTSDDVGRLLAALERLVRKAQKR
jgi:hypothetical protein